MTKQRTTIKDIAKALNLSTSTVSRALADRWDVNPETRKAVLELAERLQYRPNPFSLSLKKQQSLSVGVIIPEFINSFFFLEVLIGIQSVLEPKGYLLLISHSNESAEVELKNMKALEAKMVDGFLVSITRETKDMEYFKHLVDNKTPIVFFNRMGKDLPVSHVNIDDYKWALHAVEHLIEQGCKRIVHLAGPESLGLVQERLRGYTAALKKHGIYDEKLIIPCGLLMETGIMGAMKIMEMDELPDGVFAVNDFVAIGAMKTLKKKGIKIPEDMAIVGFSESKMAMIIEPNLTSVEQPTFEIGKAAAELLLEQMSSNNEVPQRIITLEAKLNIRESSLKKPNATLR